MNKIGEKMSKFKIEKDKIITLILMMISINTIYLLPYLMYTFYTPLQEAMGLVGRDADYGRLLNIYGIVNVILYLPGGWIADMFDAKKLLVISMISTGVLGLWEATWPSYTVLMIIYVLWSFTTVLTFWSSSLKCINLIAGDEQGSMFGALEAGRGIVGLILTTIFVFVFTLTQSVTGVVVVISISMILCGIAQYFLMPNVGSEEAVNEDIKSSIKAMKQAFKLPITYLLAAMIFGACIARATYAYYTPFLENVLGMDVSKTTVFANYNSIITNIIGASIATYFATKLGRSTKPMIYAGIIMVVSYVIVILVPNSGEFLIPFLLLFIIASMGCYIFRALYYAVIDEIGTPKNMVGSVIGIASLVGFIPDTFFLSMCGGWIDKYGTDAYNMIFVACLVATLVSLIGAFISEKKVLEYKKQMAIQEEIIS